MSPAMPTTSPARALMLAPWITTRVGLGRVMHRPVLDAKDLFTDLRRAIRVAVLEVAADHAADDAVLRHLVGTHVERLDRAAVTDDRDLVGDRLDLVQLVADDDRRDALALEVLDEVEQVGGVLVVEGRGRLVEDQDLHLFGERLRDLHELLLADPDVVDLRGGVIAQADPSEELRSLEVGLVPVDEPTARDLVAEEDVLGDREERAQRELLMDDDDAALLAVADVAKAHGLALEDDVALVGAVGVDPREHLHEGGLAGAVLTADRVYRAAFDGQAHILQRFDARERLGDALHLENVGDHSLPRFVVWLMGRRSGRMRCSVRRTRPPHQ
jgi:hypothetical protein